MAIMHRATLSPIVGRLFPAARSLPDAGRTLHCGRFVEPPFGVLHTWGATNCAIQARPWGFRVECKGPFVAASSFAEDPKFQSDATNSNTQSFCVINFYHLLEVEEPHIELELHRSFLSDAKLDIKGRIYVSAQGINAQYSGPSADALKYAHWLKARDGFESLSWHIWEVNGHQFPKLRLQLKAGLIQLKGGTGSLPITDASKRATPLQPSEWREMLKNAQRPIVLDVRNNYEWDAGHFEGAARPIEENFIETPVADENNTASEGIDSEDIAADAPLPAYLKGVNKDEPIMMYCTGGIRCDIYSAYLRKQGFDNLYTLEGGIANYLKHEGDDQWNGSMFVFDDRLALGFSKEGEESISQATKKGLQAASDPGANLPAAVPCQLCGDPEAVLPHLNCANVLCNKLFIACEKCRKTLSSCCSHECTTAPRLRIRIEDGSWVEKVQNVDAESPWASGSMMKPDVSGRVVTPKADATMP